MTFKCHNFVCDMFMVGSITITLFACCSFLNFFCSQHCAGINCLAVLKSPVADGCDYLFTGSRDSTLKRWSLAEDGATCSQTYESHVDWVLPFLALGSIYDCGISLMNH